MSLDPVIEERLDEGTISHVDLIRFDLPGKTVGYHRGTRPFTHNGFTYAPNQWLSPGEMFGETGPEVTSRQVIFSNVPAKNPDAVIKKLESYQYTNAPAIVTHLSVDPATGEVDGDLVSWLYEIKEVTYEVGEQDGNGMQPMTIRIELEPPGRSARGSTAVKRSKAEQQFDNDPDDTAFDYVGPNEDWSMRWSRVPKE